MHKTLSTPTPAELREIRDFLSAKTGLHLMGEKDEELQTLLTDRISKNFKDRSVETYIRELNSAGDGGAELRYLVGQLTVGETHFFRNRPQFEALRRHILPELIKKRRSRSRHLRIWSAGCSTGEEPYSLAMLVLQLLPDIADWSVSILATDINETALEAARAGFYRDWSFRDVDEYYRRRFFTPEDRGWQISDEVISMVQFRYLNLADDLYPAAVTRTDSLDLVVCRNVMIYFNRELSVAITKRFFRCLEEGGYLLVGHSEHSELVHGEFLRRLSGGAIFYKKEAPGESWEQAIKPRFRGSGRPAGNLLTASESGFRKRGDQRPPSTEETVEFERAVTAYRTMRMEESLDIFRAIVAKNADNERARYMIALLLANAGKLDEAEAQVQDLLEVNSLHLEGIYLLAMICRVRGEGEREIAQLKKTVFLDKEFVLGHFQMGVYYLRKGNGRLARRSLQNVLNLLDGREDSAVLDGVEGLSVGRLRGSIEALMPGRTKGR